MNHQLFIILSVLSFLCACSRPQLRLAGNTPSQKKVSPKIVGDEQKVGQAQIEKLRLVPNHAELLSREDLKGILEEVLPPTDTHPKKVEKEKPVLSKKLKKYCAKIQNNFRHWGWGYARCQNYPWHHVRNSVLGTPLIWMAFGDEKAHNLRAKNTTMILCGVHGDEITPIKFCFDIIKFLEEHPELYRDRMVVVAPIVNPDSYFKRYPTRTNQRKVDINRNFPTRDWHAKARSLWKKRYRSDRRRNPGKRPMSEPEVLFQVNLIKRYNPNKLISVHAPLTLIDYDGPIEQAKSKGLFQKQLLITMSEKAEGYKIKDYPFFPGSLGNWAGNERKIPTYTLELPSSDSRNHKKYWKMFRPAIQAAIVHDFNKSLELAETAEENKKSMKKN